MCHSGMGVAHEIKHTEGNTMVEGLSTGLIAVGAGIAIGLSAIGAAIAEARIGAAAVGAMAEREALFGKGLILTVIPETLVIFGMVVAILIIGLAG